MLTDTKIRNTKPADKPIKLPDSNGLYLEIRTTGAKLWRYRYRIGGKENVFAIGEFFNDKRAGHVSLEDARAMRAAARNLVKQGIHPAHDRQATKTETVTNNGYSFKALSTEWIDSQKSHWSPYYHRQVERFLSVDTYPYIGSLPIKSVTAAHLLQIVKRIEDRGAPTVAILVRQWISAIFRYSIINLKADNDPATALKGVIRRPRVKHHRPLSREQIPLFITALESFGGYRTTVIALRLMLLTFVRTIELRAAEWKEFNLDCAEWRIPAERMKMRETHIVPLSKQSVELLRELHTHTGGRGFLFPNYRNPKTCMSATTLNRALERMGFNGAKSIDFSAHGFRATASTILNEAGFRNDVIERQLAHADRDQVRAAYNQGEYLAERKKMMQFWSDLMDELSTNRSTSLAQLNT